MKDRKHTGARLFGRLVARIIANGIAAMVAGYLYEAGRKAHERFPAEKIGQAFGNLLADSDAHPASEEAGTGRFSEVKDL